MIQAAAPSAEIYGHPRKNWQPLPLQEPARPVKGAGANADGGAGADAADGGAALPPSGGAADASPPARETDAGGEEHR